MDNMYSKNDQGSFSRLTLQSLLVQYSTDRLKLASDLWSLLGSKDGAIVWSTEDTNRMRPSPEAAAVSSRSGRSSRVSSTGLRWLTCSIIHSRPVASWSDHVPGSGCGLV